MNSSNSFRYGGTILWAACVFAASFCFAYVIGCNSAAPAAAPLQTPALVREVVERSVTIRTGERTLAAGVVIESGGWQYVLTCAHVTEGEEDFNAVLYRRPGAPVSLTEVFRDPEADIALLWTDKHLPVAPLEVDPRSKAYPGDQAWFCGSALRQFNLCTTHVSKWEPRELFLVGGGGWYGHSGSGVFVKRGGTYELVGLVQGSPHEQGKLITCVPLASIVDFLERYNAAE